MTNSNFSPGDWIVIVAYLIGIIGLGIWFGKDQRNTRDYFLGSRNIPWWGIGFSIVAAETSALTIIGVPAMAYGGNIAFVQMIVGYVIARIILAIVLVPHYFKGEIYSPYQLFANTFGPSARQTAGGFFLISETLAAGVRVYVASIPVKLMLGGRLLGIWHWRPYFRSHSALRRALPPLHLHRRRQSCYLDRRRAIRFVHSRRRLRLVLYPDARRWRLEVGTFPGSGGGQAALAQLRAGRNFLGEISLWTSLQYLDGRYRRNRYGDVFPWCGTVNRATGACL
jgi:hypothetical protein